VADIFDEVRDDLRAERSGALLKRYGGLLAVALIVVLAAVGGWQIWRTQQAKQADAAAGTFLAAMHDAAALPLGPSPNRLAAADAFAAVAARAPESYRVLARLREASLRADAGDGAAADALWDQVSHDDAAPRLLRDLASLLWAQHGIDRGDPAAVQVRLDTLTAPENPWRPLAQEAQAWLALRLGHRDDAQRLLGQLATDGTAPDGVRGRANGLLTLFKDGEAHG